MNPDTIVMTNGKGVTKAFSGSTRPKEVYLLRSDYEHDEAGVWNKEETMKSMSIENARDWWKTLVNQGFERILTP